MQILHMLTRGVGEGSEVKRGKNKRKRRENSCLLSSHNGTHVMLQNLRFLKWKLHWDFEPNSIGFEWRLLWSFNYENWEISLEWWDMRYEILTTQTGPWKSATLWKPSLKFLWKKEKGKEKKDFFFPKLWIKTQVLEGIFATFTDTTKISLSVISTIYCFSLLTLRTM